MGKGQMCVVLTPDSQMSGNRFPMAKHPVFTVFTTQEDTEMTVMQQVESETSGKEFFCVAKKPVPPSRRLAIASLLER